MDKGAFFLANSKRVRPDETDGERIARRAAVVEAWQREGLALRDVYGSVPGSRVGNSFDAQRLILLARAQGREDALIEAVYGANHEKGRCLGDRAVLLACAEAAAVEGAAEMLDSNEGRAEVAAAIARYRTMGICSVPVVVIGGRYCLQGLPDEALLRDVLGQLARTGCVSEHV